jgi:hypothetical protein
VFKIFTLKKLLPTFFLSALAAVFFVPTIAAATLFILPAPAQAASKPMSMNLEVPIPTLHGGSATIKFTGDTSPIADYVKAIYTYAVAAVGIVAAVVMMIGGLMWITAGGNASSISEAKAMITASLTGLVLVIVSYLMLNQVNPALTNLQITKISPPESTQTPAADNCSWDIADNNTAFNPELASNKCAKDFNSTAALIPASVGKCGAATPTLNAQNKGDGNTTICCCSLPADTNNNCSWQKEQCSDAIVKSPNGFHNNDAPYIEASLSAEDRELLLEKCGTNRGDNKYCCCPGSSAASCNIVSPINCQSCSNCQALPANLTYNDNSQFHLTHNQVQLNSTLISMLNSITSPFTITEAWPPTVNHQSPCHQNGTCIDLSPASDISGFATQLKNAGFTSFQYECKTGPTCCTGLPAATNCKYNAGASGPHFHVNGAGITDAD